MKCSNRSRSMVAAFALSLVPAPWAANGIHVTIAGSVQGDFRGESTVRGHEGSIEGLSFDYALTIPQDAGTVRTRAVAQYGQVGFTKQWGASSVQLFQAIVKNENLREVVFKFVRTNQDEGLPETFYIVTLENAQVAKFRQGIAHEGGLPLDSIGLTYETITVEALPGNTTATGDARGIAARSAGSAFGLSYSVDKGSFRVELPDQEVELRFLDLGGSLVKTLSARGGEVRFDARSLGVQPGMYLLKASVAGNSLGTVPVTIAK